MPRADVARRRLDMRSSGVPDSSADAACNSVRLRSGVTLHLVGDQGILLDGTSQKLFRLNTSAAFLWCCIEAGASVADCAERLQTTFGTSEGDARNYVSAAIERWKAAGVVSGCEARTRPIASSILAMGSAEPSATVPPLMAVAERNYRLLDTGFHARFASHETAAYADRFLAPLKAWSPSAAARVVVDVRERDNQYGLFHGGRLIERWGGLDELVPIFKIGLVSLALERSRDFAALHAGAVHRRDACIIVAGPSGAGKSTLIAALEGIGFHSLGDDTIVLAEDDLAVRPIPFGICLKDGAWPLLAERIADIQEQPHHRRLDGKIVKYLVRDLASREPPADRLAARAVVFPNRTEGGGPAELRRVRPIDALIRLTSEFCPLGEGLDRSKIDRLIEWVHGMTCVEMRYSTLDEGVKLIEELS